MSHHTRAALAPTVLAITLLTGGALAGCSAGSSTPTGTSHSTPAAAASLPANFPKSDVPLVTGKILAVTGDTTTGWSVTIVPAAKGGLAAATDLLKKAGYTISSSKQTSAYLSGPKYDVLLSSPGDTVTYAISPAE